MKVLRIVFCLLACACVVAAIPIGILCDVIYLVLDLFVALAFIGAMVLCKRKTETHRTADYMNSDEENEEIRREVDQSDHEK